MNRIVHVIALLALFSAPAFSQDLSGTYQLRRIGAGGNATTLWVSAKGKRYEVVREVVRGGVARVVRGTGVWRKNWLRVVFKPAAGMDDALTGDKSTWGRATKARYHIKPGSGNVYGHVRIAGQNQREYGKRTADRPAPGSTTGSTTGSAGGSGDEGQDAKILSPRPSTVAVGQELKLEFQPTGAQIKITGSAERVGNVLRITGPGKIVVEASASGQSSPAVELEAVEVAITEIQVLDDLPLADVKSPQFRWPLKEREAKAEPAAVFAGRTLRLRLKLQATADLSDTAKIMLSGKAEGLNFLPRAVNLRHLREGTYAVVESNEALHEGVAINTPDLSWTLGKRELPRTTPLRVYTTFASPVRNIARDSSKLATKRHFENACFWAEGTKLNVGDGPDSIGHRVDNRFRHYVHWKDLDDKGFVPVVPDYPRGSEAPKNYKDLMGLWNLTPDGKRGNYGLYYPPLSPNKDYQQYSNYRDNFGWKVLDNPDYVGGRCNQQASLVCAVLGTLGIKGEVLYIERVGRGPLSGRPVRQYFYSNDKWPAQSATGGGPWNFHGVALVTLGDDSKWIYDGSFSAPPNRKNGTRTWAENAGGPFIHSWGPWLYDDVGGRAPSEDIPSTWRGIPAAPGE